MCAESRRPLISIITVVLNGAKTLAATIESVHRQTFRDFEYLVLDGGSTDGTIGILERHREHVTHWTSEPDAGIYDAWNKALRRARGEWIAFLGADDTYYPEALDSYARAIADLPQSGTHYISSRVHLEKDGKIVRTVGGAWTWPTFSRFMTVAHVGSLHHRSLFEQYGPFDASYRVCGDYELLLRPRHLLRAAFVDRVTVKMALGGVSNSNVTLALREQERAKRVAGGRPAWICAMERKTAHIKALRRSIFGH